MLKTLAFVSLILAALTFAFPASAGNPFISVAATAPTDDVSTDAVSGAFQLGWDFGTPTLALEYDMVTEGEDVAYIVGGLDFGKGSFRPGIRAGVGAEPNDFDNQYLQLYGGLTLYVMPNVGLEAGYRWVSDLGDVGDGDGQYVLGARLEF